MERGSVPRCSGADHASTLPRFHASTSSPYALGWNVSDDRYELLPCAASSNRPCRLQRSSMEPIRFNVAGLVTQFRGRQYLLLQRAVARLQLRQLRQVRDYERIVAGYSPFVTRRRLSGGVRETAVRHAPVRTAGRRRQRGEPDGGPRAGRGGRAGGCGRREVHEGVRPRGASAGRVSRRGPGPRQGARSDRSRASGLAPQGHRQREGVPAADLHRRPHRSLYAGHGDSIHADSTGRRLRARCRGPAALHRDHDRRAGPGGGREGDRRGLAAAIPGQHPSGDPRGLPRAGRRRGLPARRRAGRRRAGLRHADHPQGRQDRRAGQQVGAGRQAACRGRLRRHRLDRRAQRGADRRQRPGESRLGRRRHAQPGRARHRQQRRRAHRFASRWPRPFSSN